jgi:hypothetical protein
MQRCARCSVSGEWRERLARRQALGSCQGLEGGTRAQRRDNHAFRGEEWAGKRRNPRKQRNPNKGRENSAFKEKGGKNVFYNKWRLSTCKHRFQQAWGYRSGEHDRKAFRFGSMTASRLWPLLEQRSAACAVAPPCFACAKPTLPQRQGGCCWHITDAVGLLGRCCSACLRLRGFAQFILK